jgi:hypothetical protein
MSSYFKANETIPDYVLCDLVMSLSEETDDFVTLERILPHCTGKSIEEITWLSHATRTQVEACVNRFSRVLVSVVHESQ